MSGWRGLLLILAGLLTRLACTAASSATPAAAQSACDLALTAGNLQSAVASSLAGDLIKAGIITVQRVQASGFCGSVGISAPTVAGALPGSGPAGLATSTVVLSTGHMKSGLLHNSRPVASASTNTGARPSPAHLNLLAPYTANVSALRDLLVLDIDFGLGAQAPASPHSLTLSYAWATAELGLRYPDLAVLLMRRCADDGCADFAPGSTVLLSTSAQLAGESVSVRGLQRHHSALLRRNAFRAYPVPFQFFAPELATVPAALQPGARYRLTAAVADVRDALLDTVLMLGRMQVEEVHRGGDASKRGSVWGSSAAVGGLAAGCAVALAAAVLGLACWLHRSKSLVKSVPLRVEEGLPMGAPREKSHQELHRRSGTSGGEQRCDTPGGSSHEAESNESVQSRCSAGSSLDARIVIPPVMR